MVLEKTLESPLYGKEIHPVHPRGVIWSWNSNTLVTWCEELIHLKRPWFWERSRAGGEGDDGGWEGWMASLTRWRWVWVNSGCWWWTGRYGVLQFMGSQRVRHDWVTEVNWTEAEDIKTRWQEYTEELYKKDFHDPDNHDGVITHLEPDILECEVKWALGSITTNKASGGDGIPVELFQILKHDAVKVLHSICQQIWKTQQWPQDWKKVSFHPNPKERQCQRMLKLPHNCTHLTH